MKTLDQLDELGDVLIKRLGKMDDRGDLNEADILFLSKMVGNVGKLRLASQTVFVTWCQRHGVDDSIIARLQQYELSLARGQADDAETKLQALAKLRGDWERLNGRGF